jgi:tRNA A37 threonylcarbamoyladenosine biosynthesis protein TsaE
MPTSETETSYIATPAFQDALACIASGAPVTFISGKAGTGKSTFTKNELTKLPGNTVFLSPTGMRRPQYRRPDPPFLLLSGTGYFCLA